MNRFKRIFVPIITVFAILLPFLSVGVLSLLLPNPYENSFVGALDDKYELLSNTEGEKIVIVGGSSVAFGIESELIEKYTDMKTVNFGLYAALGTRVMMELSRGKVGEGDIVILAPELDRQTLSLYFSAEQTLMALDGSPELVLPLSADSKLSLLGGLFRHTAKKLDYFLASRTENPDGVYNAKNFDKNGDLSYERRENIMPVYRDENNLVSISPDIVAEDFIDYVNEYTEYCRKRGAEVYFAFCPVNELGLAEGTTDASFSLFENYLKDNLECKILGSLSSSVMEAGYFYDTNFHLNEAGAVAYTAGLLENILTELGSIRSIKEEIPEAPALPEFDTLLEYYDENEVYFIFSELPDKSYAIVGLTELGKSQSVLTVPRSYMSRKVTVLGEGALSGGVLEKLVIPENTSLHRLADGAFSDATRLTELYIEYPHADMLKPPASFAGTPDSLVVYIPSASSYQSDYYWSERGLNFKIIENSD